MSIEIESQVILWEFDTSDLFVYLLNLINLCNNRQELERVQKYHSRRPEFERNFIWGFGARHFWLKQRNPSNGKPVEERLLLVILNEKEI